MNIDGLEIYDNFSDDNNEILNKLNVNIKNQNELRDMFYELKQNIDSFIDKKEISFIGKKEINISDNIHEPTYLRYHQLEQIIDKDYFDINDRYSNALDILASYLKGQKIIYMESKDYCDFFLHCLMGPAILFSTTATVLSSFINNYNWGKILIASVNGTIAFLLTLVNYFKLDAKSEAHKITSHRYDKIQSSVEFKSGKLFLFRNDLTDIINNDTNKKDSDEADSDVAVRISADHAPLAFIDDIQKEMNDKLLEVEKTIAEIKETNQFPIPKTIRTRYSTIYNTNIFAIIKKIEDFKKRAITLLVDVKNEIRWLDYIKKKIEFKIKHEDKNLEDEYKNIVNKINELYSCKNKALNQIIILKSAYSVIDQMFEQEIINAEHYRKNWIKINCCFYFYKLFYPKSKKPRELNKFITLINDPLNDEIYTKKILIYTAEIEEKLFNDKNYYSNI